MTYLLKIDVSLVLPRRSDVAQGIIIVSTTGNAATKSNNVVEFVTKGKRTDDVETVVVETDLVDRCLLSVQFDLKVLSESVERISIVINAAMRSRGLEPTAAGEPPED